MLRLLLLLALACAAAAALSPPSPLPPRPPMRPGNSSSDPATNRDVVLGTAADGRFVILPERKGFRLFVLLGEANVSPNGSPSAQRCLQHALLLSACCEAPTDDGCTCRWQLLMHNTLLHLPSAGCARPRGRQHHLRPGLVPGAG